ncbi:hypothetical protein [Phenylobacterium sp. SCN 70-31]|uniref:hypothetical protein n=1 Tax=Phenylobacterium sp. SCN 70-31 TaxID=1660129 RepID=UPI00086EDCB6|nr:hypothetical protein [Phenylobacterium sp. SCN 70-31]ODT85334.1 MAG: hypothetical protein ABS78_20865 [Phenylobacterium sp. SCN 70-31]
MARLDLDDLPPKIAALLEGLSEGDDLTLVRRGAVVRRLTAGAAAVAEAPPADQPPEQHMAEVFETFRSAIEDEF